MLSPKVNYLHLYRYFVTSLRIYKIVAIIKPTAVTEEQIMPKVLIDERKSDVIFFTLFCYQIGIKKQGESNMNIKKQLEMSLSVADGIYLNDVEIAPLTIKSQRVCNFNQGEKGIMANILTTFLFKTLPL